MAAASHGNQRFDLGPRAVIDVDLTEISAISENALGSTELSGKRLDLLDHWHQLLVVVGRLRDLGGDDQHAAGGHDRLRVVALVKAATSDVHDARVFIRQIDFILRTHRPLVVAAVDRAASCSRSKRCSRDAKLEQGYAGRIASRGASARSLHGHVTAAHQMEASRCRQSRVHFSRGAAPWRFCGSIQVREVILDLEHFHIA